MLHKGQRVICKPQNINLANLASPDQRQLTGGTIDYIHPKGRFVRVAFQIHRWIVRECFFPWEVTPQRNR